MSDYAAQRAYKERSRELGLCLNCGQSTGTALKHCAECLKKIRAKNTRYTDLRAQGLCGACGKVESTTALCDDCQAKRGPRQRVFRQKADYKAAARERAKRNYWVAQTKVFDHYGRSCVCCGEAEPAFLAIDHIENDGAAHRKEIGRGNLYFWLVNQGFPPGFQVLCHNCNWAKHRLGRCPHQVAV